MDNVEAADLAGDQGTGKDGVNQQIGEAGIPLVCLLDVIQEHGPDDASSLIPNHIGGSPQILFSLFLSFISFQNHKTSWSVHKTRCSNCVFKI